MAAWYEPAGGASRATCVAQIVTDINSYITTSTDGLTTFDIEGFMALAATRLAAIPDPTATGEYYVMAGVLRSTNVRPDVEVLLGSLESVQVNNAGYDLQPHIVELQRLSDAVTAYYNRLYNDLLPDLLDNYLAAGSLELGLPAVDDTTTETRFYRTTFVTDWGEESAPSDVSVSVEVGSKDTVTIGRGTVPSGRNISYWRVYRSAHGSETSAWLYTPNSASDQGVAVATTTFTDDVPNSELQEVCPSLIWSEPPTNLRGLVGMANGINVGFFDNVLCPTPAYVPYAFPEEYRVTVEWPIVGLGAWEQSVFVGTTGTPYFLTGADAANLTARKLNSNQSCVSAQSIYPVEEGVVYASPDGLCLATLGGVRLITEQHWTRAEWQALGPANLKCAEHDGVLHLLFTGGTPVMYVLDLRTGKLGTMSVGSATALYADRVNDTLFVAEGTGAVAVTGGTTRRTGAWERLFVAQAYATYAWLQAQSTFLDADNSAASVTVTVSNAAGTVLATTVVTSVDPVKITPFYEREFYVKVESKAQVSAVHLATSTKELQAL